ncbi:MAG: adenine deaminase [Deltaproteobacteria bacterium]|nr:adenine deaminase [Deltaproteobacteria bacterium]
MNEVPLRKAGLKSLKKRILVARRKVPADRVLRRCRVVNVFSGTSQPGDVAIVEGYIAGVGEGYKGREELDLEGRWVAPGLIDAHMHVESTMMLPSRLAGALLPRGTTTLVSDPHEIANVLGIEGIRLLIRDSESTPLDFYFMAPSCVPATTLETSGARLEASDLAQVKGEPRVLGLGEVMNYPGVVEGEERLLEKVLLFAEEIIDGHAPGLGGDDLQAYVAAGITSDHETYGLKEGLEKLQSGMMLFIREGSSAKNLEELLPLVKANNSRRFCLVSDDLHPYDLFNRGHLDHILRRAVEWGLDPFTAIQMASLNPAEHFGLRGRGAVAPGFHADIIVMDDLESFRVEKVFKDGVLVAEGGRTVRPPGDVSRGLESRKLNIAKGLSPESFRISSEGGSIRIMVLVPDQILTDERIEPPLIKDGWVIPDIERDILKLAVIERHRATGRLGLGMVRGFGLESGAICSSVSHDSHNVIALGTNDLDMFRAVSEVKEMGGGFVVVKGGKVTGRVQLEIGGLMSTRGINGLLEQLDRVKTAARSLGCKLEDPFTTLSFLALPVIPKLKLTDMGLVDVENFTLVPLFVRE